MMNKLLKTLKRIKISVALSKFNNALRDQSHGFSIIDSLQDLVV